MLRVFKNKNYVKLLKVMQNYTVELGVCKFLLVFSFRIPLSLCLCLVSFLDKNARNQWVGRHAAENQYGLS